MTRKKARTVWRVTVDLRLRHLGIKDHSPEQSALIVEAGSKIMDKFLENRELNTDFLKPTIMIESRSKKDAEEVRRHAKRILNQYSKKSGIDLLSPQDLEPKLWSCETQLCPTCSGSGFVARGHRVKF